VFLSFITLVSVRCISSGVAFGRIFDGTMLSWFLLSFLISLDVILIVGVILRALLGICVLMLLISWNLALYVIPAALLFRYCWSSEKVPGSNSLLRVLRVRWSICTVFSTPVCLSMTIVMLFGFLTRSAIFSAWIMFIRFVFPFISSTSALLIFLSISSVIFLAPTFAMSSR